MKQLNYDDVMAAADYIYSELCEAESRPQSMTRGIKSLQVKALALALVRAINYAHLFIPAEDMLNYPESVCNFNPLYTLPKE